MIVNDTMYSFIHPNFVEAPCWVIVSCYLLPEGKTHVRTCLFPSGVYLSLRCSAENEPYESTRFYDHGGGGGNHEDCMRILKIIDVKNWSKAVLRSP